jgi:Protein of unknown function (DUF2911)
MKKSTLLIALLILTIQKGFTQLKMPIPSPAAKVEQQVGVSNVSITYHRPSLRGRKLLGQPNIPYGKVWRLGANEATTIEVTDSIQIEDKILPKGKYALMAIPDEKEWTIIVNGVSNQWGAYQYKEKKDVFRFNVKAENLSKTEETLSFTFEDIQPSEASLVFRWENVQCKIKLKQDADNFVMAQIKKKTSMQKPDLEELMEAAEYYLLKDRDLEQALVWATKVLEKYKSPFVYNLQAQIAQKLSKCPLAKEAATKAVEYATKNRDVAAAALANDIIAKCQ